MKTPLQNEMAQRAYQRRRHWLFFKEVTLLVVVAAVAGLSMYVARDNHSAFGLLPARPVLADALPVVTSFRTQALTDEAFLELDTHPTADPDQQVSATVFDPTNPPPVLQLNALNTRVGGEVALFWTRPEGVDAVSIYRASVKDPEAVELERLDTTNETLVAESVTDETWLDADVKDGTVYQYRVVSLYEYDGEVYESEEGAVDTVIPGDSVPPLAPSDVVVRSTNAGEDLALEVLWAHPTEEDFDHVTLYRSTVYGDRGDEVAQVKASAEARYLDTAVAPNTTYYYTIVAYDEAGNASSADFQAPAPGNEHPFTPITSAAAGSTN